MSILQIENLIHSFGEKKLYSGASFVLNRGEHMGVVGQNGVGKSTLIKILMGEIIPERGEIKWQGEPRIGFIDQYAETDGSLTIRDYLLTAFSGLFETEKRLAALYERMDGAADDGMKDKMLAQAARFQEHLEKEEFYTISSKAERVAEGLGLAAIGLDRTLDTLSGGQHTKAILGKLLLSRPDVLLLDEPTNFLDAEHIAWLSEYLRAFKGAFVIVSHDFGFLESVTDCICDVEFQTIKKYSGGYSAFIRQKEQRRETYARVYAAQRKEIGRLEAYIAKNKARASTAQMAKSRQKKLDRMEKLAPPSLLSPPDIMFPEAPPPPQKALSVEKLLIGYDRPLLPELNFNFEGGVKYAVTGFNGIGKSTFLKTLAGVIPFLSGGFEFAQTVKIGYFEQDMLWPSGSLTPLEIMLGEFPELLPKHARRALARCGVSAKNAMQKVSTLSGGEQNKVKLCRLTMRPHNFLMLDEPTNHLDAETKESLMKAIRAFSGTVILVCHEEAFYQGCADYIIDVESLLI